MNANETLKQYYQFFMDNIEELAGKYKGRFVVIKDNAVVGDYDSEMEAYSESVKQFPLGTFLIQECKSSDKESYTQTFRSRVRFC